MKALILILLMAFTVSVTAQTLIFDGTATITSPSTITSSTITVSAYPKQVWPELQVFVDYVSGSTNMAVVGWHSLDNVRWDTIPGFYWLYTAEADLTAEYSPLNWSQTVWKTPLLTKYIKFTARGFDSTQVIIPKAYFAYKTVP